MGAHAVMTLLEATSTSETKVICLKANNIVKMSLMECVQNTLEIAKAIEQKDFQKALELRGTYVHANNIKIYFIFCNYHVFIYVRNFLIEFKCHINRKNLRVYCMRHLILI